MLGSVDMTTFRWVPEPDADAICAGLRATLFAVLVPLRAIGGTSEAHFLRTRCVSADAAAVFAALLDFGSRRTRAAADAARALVDSFRRFIC